MVPGKDHLLLLQEDGVPRLEGKDPPLQQEHSGLQGLPVRTRTANLFFRFEPSPGTVWGKGGWGTEGGYYPGVLWSTLEYPGVPYIYI